MSSRQNQGTILFTALLVLIGVGVVVQLWLLTASVDALFLHETVTPIRAAIASVVVFAVNGLLVRYVFHFDRKVG